MWRNFPILCFGRGRWPSGNKGAWISFPSHDGHAVDWWAFICSCSAKDGWLQDTARMAGLIRLVTNKYQPSNFWGILIEESLLVKICLWSVIRSRCSLNNVQNNSTFTCTWGRCRMDWWYPKPMHGLCGFICVAVVWFNY